MTSFRKNPAFEREMAVQPGTIAFVEAKTVEVAETATVLAPERTGYYKRRIKAKRNRVVAQDFGWHWVEFGSVHNIAFSPLRRAVVAVGLKLKPTPKK